MCCRVATRASWLRSRAPPAGALSLCGIALAVAAGTNPARWRGFKKAHVRFDRARDLNAIPLEQTRPDRPTAEEVVSAVADVFEFAPEVVLDRSHQSAFKAAVYLLRRACNLPLTETVRLGGVSPSRISRIQVELEKGKRLATMEALFRWYKVKH